MELYNIYNNEFAQDFANKLYKEKLKNDFSQIVFLCVGTDRVIGDCIGPLVGSKLNELFKDYNVLNVNIYGSLQENINYINVKEIVNKIKKNHNNACIVVVDAALSKKENIGRIFVSNSKTILGKGINKNKIEIGDISIKAVVAKDFKISRYNFKNLQEASLGFIMNLSQTVAQGIFDVIKYS